MTTNAVEVMDVMNAVLMGRRTKTMTTNAQMVMLRLLFCFVLLLFRDSDQDERPRWEECRDDEADNDEAR